MTYAAWKHGLLGLFVLLLGAAGPLDRAQRADGAPVVPDHFLRGFDPVTVFFDADTGPTGGGPEDAPGRFVTLQPAVDGAWQWLGVRTLQFRPTEAWQPLHPVRVTVSGHVTILTPLLPIPVQTGPDDPRNGTAGLDRIGLSFAVPVDRVALARLITIEVRPQPGLSVAGAQLLTGQDFDVTAAESASAGDAQTYVVALHQPIADGQVALLHLRLADAPGLDVPSFELRLRSATAFGFTDARCGTGYDGAVQDGLQRCTPGDDGGAAPRSLRLRFSAPPEALDVVRARDVLRITPHVEALTTRVEGNALVVAARFQADTVYTLSVAAGALHDGRGRGTRSPALQRFAFAAAPPTLRWDAAQGIVERLGPQMLPLRGQGYDRADLRIHPIDPLSRDFWPFPPAGLITSDDTPPPLSGREPAPWTDPQPISADDMALRLQALGSPSVSELVTLPIAKGAVETRFGLDVAPLLARIAGVGQPGSYLVGLRPVNAQDRHWLRVQVTDLSLTTVEEGNQLRFTVTSLATAQPVAGAAVELQGVRGDAFATLRRGVTDAAGGLAWIVPAKPEGTGDDLRRIVVTKGADTLVLDPRRAPVRYADGAWNRAPGVWLGWAAQGAVADRGVPDTLLCHVYTERPIYRPEEPVHIAGMVRHAQAGALSLAAGAGTVLVTGPDQQEWRLPVTLDQVGGFHVDLTAKTDATGDYAVEFQPGASAENQQPGCGAMSFKKEAYRLPSFEVLLNAPTRTALDQPFTVGLQARWFAGGLLSDRPISWQVTQFPAVFAPPARDGFAFSSDSRYSSDATFRSTPVLTREAKSDAGGSAQLVLDPTIEPTAQPREYVVEATVTGDDDIQVRSVQHVLALPPFVLGLKLPRYIDHPGAIDAEMLALDNAGKPLPGLAVTAKLIRRRWNSLLQASDFASGDAKYSTQVIDETVEERHLAMGDAAQPLRFAAAEAGVYIVELTASDRLGRAQTVRVDSFMAGDTPVTWSRPPAQTATISPDKPSYAPGETATLLIQSPFQSARALALVERPEGGFTADWVPIENGVGHFTVGVRKTMVPKLPVHVLLMRGRLSGAGPAAAAPFDQGKPVTIAATSWLTVSPIDNQVKVSFDAPASARPGQAIDLVLHLTDMAGQPRAGEATVWMVDQAVLSLAREQALDPLPQFLVPRPSRLEARDTRNLAFGLIPLAEAPGGDEGAAAGLENISVRRNFTPVPFYAPRVMFGADGTARLHVVLPDTLTVYKLRAKAVSGPDRFGVGTGEMRVRLPVVAQAALPRFVRAGDRFQAGLIGRVVEGPNGPGHAVIAAQGATVAGPTTQALSFDAGKPTRLDFPITLADSASGVARVTLRVLRDADQVGDAVQLDLPIRADREAVDRRALSTLAASGALTIPPLAEAARAGSLSRQVTIASDPTLVRLVAGLDTLRTNPFGNTDQRVSLAGAELAMRPFGPLLAASGLQDRITADVTGTVQAIGQAVDENGLVAYWPRGRGSVLLTAWSYGFLVRAERAGLPADKPLQERLARVLQQALRSDYPQLFAPEAVRERVAALLALAEAGALQPDFATELARRAAQLPTESLAKVVTVVARLPPAQQALLPPLQAELWRRVELRLQDGQSVYGGLVDSPASPLILPSETRSLATLTEAVAGTTPNEPRLPLLRTGLIRLSGADGWGNSNATAAALRALATSWQAPPAPIAVSLTLPDGAHRDTLDHDHPLVQEQTTQPGAVTLAQSSSRPLAVLMDSRFLPAGPGWQAAADAHGLVVTRALYRVPTAGPMQRLDPGPDGIALQVGDVVEEVDTLVSPDDHTNVALRLPLAAGFEPLNPALATAPAEAQPSAGPTLAPDHVAFADDQVTEVFTTLPKGSVTLRMRLRATVEGVFTQPPGLAQAMYQPAVEGSSDGARIVIRR